MNDTEFLNWIADRFVYVYDEGQCVDFVRKLRSIAMTLPPGQDTDMFLAEVPPYQPGVRLNQTAPRGATI